MKEFLTTPLSKLNNPVIGKITVSPIKKFMKRDFILVSYEGKVEVGYAAVIVTKDIENPKANVLLGNQEEIQNLCNGDIIIVETTGEARILYEKNSNHNFLLITELCNCRCIMCPNQSVNNEIDRMEEIIKIISLIDKKTLSLGITGGEPTLMGDKLIDIIKYCKKNLPYTKLIILTNGINLKDFNYVKKIALAQHPDLTLDIPFHSDTDLKHNMIIGAQGFYKTVAGLYNLAIFNIIVGIRIVIHKLNYKRLPQIAEFIYRNFPFVSHIAFMQMELTGIAKTNEKELWIDPYDYNYELEEAVLYLDRREMDISIYNAQLCILPRSLWKYAKKSISPWKNIYLEECKSCNCANICGGFFASSIESHSRYIKAMKIN